MLFIDSLLQLVWYLDMALALGIWAILYFMPIAKSKVFLWPSMSDDDLCSFFSFLSENELSKLFSYIGKSGETVVTVTWTERRGRVTSVRIEYDQTD